MKRSILLFAVLLTAMSSMAQEAANTVTIKVQLENFVNDQGHTLIALHNKQSFMTQNPVLSGKAEIHEGKASYVFTNVPPGTYAILAMHDVNDNNRMDFAATGMPEEGWATSNNDMTMGPPDFEASKFEVSDSDLQFTLRF